MSPMGEKMFPQCFYVLFFAELGFASSYEASMPLRSLMATKMVVYPDRGTLDVHAELMIPKYKWSKSFFSFCVFLSRSLYSISRSCFLLARIIPVVLIAFCITALSKSELPCFRALLRYPNTNHGGTRLS